MAGINTVRQGIGWVSLAICAAGVIAPRPLARLMGDDASLARPLALRDGAIGLAVLQSRGPLPLLLRTAADLIDAHRLRRRSPLAAAGALSFGLLALATAVALPSGSGRRRNPLVPIGLQASRCHTGTCGTAPLRTGF